MIKAITPGTSGSLCTWAIIIWLVNLKSFEGLLNPCCILKRQRRFWRMSLISGCRFRAFNNIWFKCRFWSHKQLKYRGIRELWVILILQELLDLGQSQGSKVHARKLHNLQFPACWIRSMHWTITSRIWRRSRMRSLQLILDLDNKHLLHTSRSLKIEIGRRYFLFTTTNYFHRLLQAEQRRDHIPVKLDLTSKYSTETAAKLQWWCQTKTLQKN